MNRLLSCSPAKLRHLRCAQSVDDFDAIDELMVRARQRAEAQQAELARIREAHIRHRDANRKLVGELRRAEKMRGDGG